MPQERTYRLKLSGGYWSLQDAYVRITPKGSREDAQNAEQTHQAEEARAEREQQAEQRRKAGEERVRVEKERKEAIEAAKWRTWTDATGEHKIEAQFGGLAFGKVKLIKRDGSTVRLPLEKLSDEDQKWVKGKKWLE